VTNHLPAVPNTTPSELRQFLGRLREAIEALQAGDSASSAASRTALSSLAKGDAGGLIGYSLRREPKVYVPGAAGYVLTSNGASVEPSYQPAVPAVPAGAVADYAGSTAPDGWLLCYGQAVSRTTYANLYTAIGTTYGVGDGSTTFNLPDLRGRVVAGKDDMGGVSANRLTDQSGGLNGDTLGDTGGAETHLLTSSESGVPAHTHSYLDGQVIQTNGSANGSNFGPNTDVGRITSPNAAADASSAHNNVQPTIILNKIIKT